MSSIGRSCLRAARVKKGPAETHRPLMRCRTASRTAKTNSPNAAHVTKEKALRL